MEKYDIYLESISAKQEQLTAKTQELWSNLLPDELIVNLFELGKGFMDLMNLGNGLVAKLILLGTVSLAVATAWKTLKDTKLVVSFLDVISATKAYIVSLMATIKATYATAGATGVLKAALDVLASHPIILALSVIVATVAGCIAIFNKFNVTLEEHKEMLAEAKREYDDAVSAIQELDDELKTVKSRIIELENKGVLTLVEQNELDKLRQQNAELQRQIDLERIRAKESKKKTYGEFVDSAYSITNLYRDPKDANFMEDYVEEWRLLWDGVITDDEKQALSDKIKELEEIAEGIEYIPNPTNDTEEAVNAWLDYINQMKDGYIVLCGEAEQVSNLWNNLLLRPQFEGVGDELKQLAEDGVIVGEEISNLSDKAKEFINYLVQIGLITFDTDFIAKYDKDGNGAISTTELWQASADDLAVAFGGVATQISAVANEAETASGKIEKMTYSAIISDIKDKAEDLGTAQKELAQTGYLSADSVVNLTKILPDLDQYLTSTANGYKISKEGLDKLNEAMLSQYDTALNEAKTGALNVLDQEHKKKVSYESTSAAIRKQLEDQLALAKSDAETSKSKHLNSYGYYDRRGLANDKEYQQYTAEVKAIEEAIKSLDNAQTNYDNAKNALSTIKLDKSSSSGKSATETAFDNLKKQFEADEITIDQYIQSMSLLLTKCKKGTDEYEKIKKELNAQKLDRIEKQFERGEITVDEYIQKLAELRKEYKKNTEGYKELTDKINDTKLDNWAKQFENGEITLNRYLALLKEVQSQYKKGSEQYNAIASTMTDAYIDKMDKGLDDIENKISQIGDVNTAKESVKYAGLLSEKYKYTQGYIADIRKQLKASNTTAEQKVKLQEKLNDLLSDEVDIRDEIEQTVSEYYENQKEEAELQAEANKKEILFKKEMELYGEKGKELFEWETNKKIQAIEDEIELRQKEREALDEVNEREQLTNDLLEARLQLQNAFNNKTTKILKKQEDGTWQYEYSANMQDVKSAQEAVKNAEKALDDYDFDQEIKELQDIADELNDNLDRLATQYEDTEFFVNRDYEKQINKIEQMYGDIDALTQKWVNVYGDSSEALTELVNANSTLEQSIIDLNTTIASKYEAVNNDVANIGSNRLTTTLLNSGLLSSTLLSATIAKYNGISQNVGANNINNVSGGSTIISKVECVFPNITTTDGLQKAILDLPRIALQKK